MNPFAYKQRVHELERQVNLAEEKLEALNGRRFCMVLGWMRQEVGPSVLERLDAIERFLDVEIERVPQGVPWAAVKTTKTHKRGGV
ncbi:MAG: hypothetical protein KGL39_57135 [Patescibacteria group bacterium]|nr:hypothetical protein [Patescibacteria group bacterium]